MAAAVINQGNGRTFDTERGLGRNAELASRSIRVKNLPVNTQEGVLQQLFEKFVSVKRLELFEDINEAVVELESPAVSLSRSVATVLF